jgi:hypothetical protein
VIRGCAKAQPFCFAERDVTHFKEDSLFEGPCIIHGCGKIGGAAVVVAAMYARGDIQSLGILYALSDQDLRCLWRRVRVNAE